VRKFHCAQVSVRKFRRAQVSARKFPCASFVVRKFRRPDIIISKVERRFEEIDHAKDLSMNRDGNVYVVGYYYHRLQRLDVDQN
jgi:hypothetical protein